MTSALRQQFKTDPDLETAGVWVPLGPTTDGEKTTAIRLRRMGGANKAFEKALIQGLKPIKAQMDAGVANKEVQEKIVQVAFIATVVVDWEYMEDFRDLDNPDEAAIDLTFLPGGKFVAFEAANVQAFFKIMPDLYDAAVKSAKEMTIFRAELQKAAAGN